MMLATTTLKFNLLQRFSSEIQIPEGRSFFGFQIMQSNIHAELFNILLHKFKPEQTSYLTETISLLPSLLQRDAWVYTHILESKQTFGVRLCALATYFRIFSSSAIAILLHLVNDDKFEGVG